MELGVVVSHLRLVLGTELRSGPLREQNVLLIAEPSLPLPSTLLFKVSGESFLWGLGFQSFVGEGSFLAGRDTF